MADLRWSWLAAPYLVATALIFTVVIVTALIRGDRVLRLGVIAAASSAIPWSLTQGLAALTDDPRFATLLIRLGQGPVAAVGPNLMLVLLAVSGQLERYRWIARISYLIGGFFWVMCWSTGTVVPGVQKLPSGIYYTTVGPLTGLALSQLVLWLGVGLVIIRRSSPRGERKRTLRMLLGVLVLGAIGSLDTLLLYGIWGVYPIAWLSASAAACVALFLVVRTDFLRPQGFDRAMAVELAAFGISVALVGGLALLLGTSSTLPLVTLSAIGWALMTGFAWESARGRTPRIAGERELDEFVARVPTFDDETKITERLSSLWKKGVGIEVTALWWHDGEMFTTHDGRRWKLDPEVVAWLVENSEPISVIDLATMRLGGMRAKVEAVTSAHNADLVVPLSDRGELVGIVEGSYDKALRQSERGLVAESARAAARALTFVSLGRAASRERDVARQVEVADALRLQASASREAELGRWAVAAEYRTAPRTTGAGWSAIELADGRLALLVTEAQAHGVAAAFATAAITGAFAAATAGTTRVTLDDVLRTMRASSEGVLRGGEPVAAFLAIFDAQAQTIDWACAGHPGAFLIGPITTENVPATGSMNVARPKSTVLSGGPRVRGASLHAARRGVTGYVADTLLVVASTALRGEDDKAWESRLLESAPTSTRLASVLVDQSLKAGDPLEDLLAVVVRARPLG